MKPLKPGQICTIDGYVFRAKRRTNGCEGCALDSLILCPNIVDSRNGVRQLDCTIDGIILQRI